MSRRFGIMGAAALCLLAALAGCDVVEQAREREMRRATGADKFGTATRTRLPGEERKTFEAMIESTADATWREAMSVLTLQDALRCDDGGPHSPVSSAPNDSDGYWPKDMGRSYPPGTVFRHVYVCTSEYPRTVSIPRDLEMADYASHVAAALGEERIDHQRVVMWIGVYGHKRSKYDAVMSGVGSVLMAARRHCPGAELLVRDLVLLEKEPDPDPPLGRFPPSQEFLLGSVLECQGPARAP